MEYTRFVVDAALLRELGERLIGRAHIALAELVKNSYDADAHVCRIVFGNNEIIVEDDGHGISEREFHDYWMRIGTTHKVDKRISRTLGRAMTGSKGLGRLSAQFLAGVTVLESGAPNQEETLYALIDWGDIRSGEKLETVTVGWEMRPESSSYADGSPVGTRIRLQGLKSKWDSEALEQLGREVWMLRPPRRFANVRPAGRGRSDFFVDVDAPGIEDVESSFDERHRKLLEDWKARISGVLEDGRRRRDASASVSIEFKAGFPVGMETDKRVHEVVPIPARKGNNGQTAAIDQVRFEILVFKPEGRQSSGLSVGEVRDYLREFGNVSVYDAGFRLPYYGSSPDLAGHDWLNVGADQGRRLTASELLPEHFRSVDRYMLDLPNPGRIFGWVEVNTNHEFEATTKPTEPSNWLRIQPGRDRLAHNEAFEQLRDLVRFSLDLYANRYRAFADETAEKRRVKVPPTRILQGAVRTLDHHRNDIAESAYKEVKREVVAVQRAVAAEEEALDRRAVLLAPLATAGMAALAFNHEMRREAQTLREVRESLDRLAKEQNNAELSRLAAKLSTFQARFNSYRSLFSPLAEAADRESANRLQVYNVIGQVLPSIRVRMPGVAFTFGPGVDRNVRFPTGSYVEWSAILQNVLFNAWNSMLETSRKEIRFETASASRGTVSLLISDTGVGLGVPLEDSQMLFEPFERQVEIREENKSVAIGGEGLGLAIVRMIARRREAIARFCEPKDGFSATFELTWKR